jgi:hypothetical protein
MIVALTVTASSQSTTTFVTIAPDALSQVPSEQRARLSERLELYFQKFKARDFAAIYDLTAPSCTHGLNKYRWLKQAHIESPGKMLRFDVAEVYEGDYTSTQTLNGVKWIAKGCGTYQRGAKSVKYEASVTLVQTNGEWYICWSGFASRPGTTKPVKCSDGT